MSIKLQPCPPAECSLLTAEIQCTCHTDSHTCCSRLLGHQCASQHFLGELNSFIHLDYVHATLQTIGECAQATAASQDLTLDDNLQHSTCRCQYDEFAATLTRCVCAWVIGCNAGLHPQQWSVL